MHRLLLSFNQFLGLPRETKLRVRRIQRIWLDDIKRYAGNSRFQIAQDRTA